MNKPQLPKINMVPPCGSGGLENNSIRTDKKESARANQVDLTDQLQSQQDTDKQNRPISKSSIAPNDYFQ